VGAEGVMVAIVVISSAYTTPAAIVRSNHGDLQHTTKCHGRLLQLEQLVWFAVSLRDLWQNATY
jgi:hypothetical protein